MAQSTTGDIDFTAARLHGRRSSLADGVRLDELCRIRTVGELCRNLSVDCGPQVTASGFQRKILSDYAAELTKLASGVPGEYAVFFDWMRYRFHLENIKVIVRGVFAKKTSSEINHRLIGYEVPKNFSVEGDAAKNPSLIFQNIEVDNCIRKTLTDAKDIYSRFPYLFTIETAIDCGYYRELIRRAACCKGDEGGVLALAGQETAIFLTMLALRGTQNYKLEPKVLAGFYVDGAPLPRTAFDGLMSAQLKDVSQYAGGIAFDKLPAEPAVPDIEAACWSRYLRLANRLFRRGHMNVAAIAGFVGLRRIEVANLITLSEGLRLGMDARELRARLIPRSFL